MPTLHRRTLPGLAAEVSAIGAGYRTIGGPATNRGVPIGWDHVDPDAAHAGLVRAHELGVTLFDTADVYGLGHSERLLGRLLRDVRRDELVISSKVGYFAGTARHPYDPEASPAYVPRTAGAGFFRIDTMPNMNDDDPSTVLTGGVWEPIVDS